MPKKRVRQHQQGEPDTKRSMIDAALKDLGYARASARAIARIGGFNQALIFYHFGSVDGLLLAALDETSGDRMERYRSALEEVQGLDELIEVARRNYREDLEEGHMTVVAEMVAGGVANPRLRPEISSRLREWIGFVEEVFGRFLGGSPLASVVPSPDLAFALVAFYLGLNIISRTAEGEARVEELFSAAERASPFLAPLVR